MKTQLTLAALSVLTPVSILVTVLTPSFAHAGTELVQKDGHWTLLRDGKPYLIQGAGGGGSKAALAAAGGNSFRTWGADNLQAQLDEAQKLGLTVTVGIWLEHERHGFNYSDAAAVQSQVEKVRKAVTKYKDHPAVLMWAIGNEMEGYKAGDNADIWNAVNRCAAAAKELDPTRPTMTVVAELGGKRVESIHAMCPAIDIVGVNSYGGAVSVAERYRKLGGTKPIVLTEFGANGPWEMPKNSFKASEEPTSTAKGAIYRKAYEKTVLGAPDLCLGSYAFTWGNKRETTETWFGMLLPDGSRLEPVDVLSELWTGTPPKNRCPQIKPISVASKECMPGQTLTATVEVTDPENDPLQVEWVLKAEQTKFGTGGDFEPETATFADAVAPASSAEGMGGGVRSVEVKLPDKAGVYRLYVYARDGHGGAATANIPLLAKSVTP